MQSVSEQDPVTVGLNQGQVPLAGWLPGVGRGSFWAGGQKAPQIKNKSSPPGWIKAAEWMKVSVTGAERGRRWVGAEQQGQSPHGPRLCGCALSCRKDLLWAGETADLAEERWGLTSVSLGSMVRLAWRRPRAGGYLLAIIRGENTVAWTGQSETWPRTSMF